MYKVASAYEAEQGQCLSVRLGEHLFVIGKPNEHWWLVSDQRERSGYVPASCLSPITKEDKKEVVIKSIDQAIEKIRNKTSKPSSEDASLLRELEEQKDRILSSSRSSSCKRKAPKPPPLPHRVTTTTTTQLSTEVQPSSEAQPSTKAQQLQQTAVQQNEDPKEKERERQAVTQQTEKDNTEPFVQHQVPDTLGRELVTQLGQYCRLSAKKSREALTVLLATISTQVPTSANLIDRIIDTLPQQEIDDEDLLQLGVDLANLCEIKDDAQQRNWQIQDDKNIITDLITSIVNLLGSCDESKCERLLKADDYLNVKTVVQYYQMESDHDIRMLLLQVMVMVMSLRAHFVSFLLTSVFPLELVSQLTSCHVTSQSEDENLMTTTCANVLALLMATAEDRTPQLEDTLSLDFCCHLLDMIETSEEDEQIESLIRLVLALNLNYMDPTKNKIMTSLTKSARTRLSEQLLLMLNRGVDPVVRGAEADGIESCDAIVKFLTDVYTRDTTSDEFIYTNDQAVLIDIILRNLNDLPPGNKRSELLDLLLNMSARKSFETTTPSNRIEQLKKVVGTIQRNKNEFERQIADLIMEKLEKITD